MGRVREPVAARGRVREGLAWQSRQSLEREGLQLPTGQSLAGGIEDCTDAAQGKSRDQILSEVEAKCSFMAGGPVACGMRRKVHRQDLDGSGRLERGRAVEAL